MNVKYKNVYFGNIFIFNNLKYVKTSFNRGYYWEDGRKVFKTFKKSTEVEVEGGYYEA